MRFILAALVPLALATAGYAGAWTKSHDIVGSQFYDYFRFDNIPDPTNGRVNYVDRETAVANNLTYTSDDTFVLRADFENTVAANEPGRKSVRLVSTQTFNHHVAIFDVRHMPEGCSTWPAIWEAGLETWPDAGEIDILEGANGLSPNAMTVHTSDGCTMPVTRDQTGETILTECGTPQPDSPGCGVYDANSDSYGREFNQAGGGWFAIERTDTFIKVWFWPRGGGPPGDVQSGGAQINTDNWGTPSAFFPNTQCDIGSKFGPHSIIINLTLCGDWAATTFNNDGCSDSCTDLVDNNPGAFVDAYFDIASIRIYE